MKVKVAFGRDLSPARSHNSLMTMEMPKGGTIATAFKKLSGPSRHALDPVARKFVEELCEYFRVKRLIDPKARAIESPLLHGLHRPFDDVIANKVRDIVESKGKARILELAAGSSIGINEDFGCPWLSRRLKSAWDDRIHVTVTDVGSHEFLGFRAPGEVIVVIPTFGNSLDPRIPNCSAYKLGQLDEFGISDSLLRIVSGKANFREVFRLGFLDPWFERRFFGLDRVLTGVDGSRLNESGHFENEKFDLIFMRHGAPSSHYDVPYVFEGAKRFLSNDGSCFLGTDYCLGQLLRERKGPMGSFRLPRIYLG
jgi:hypothetical protein